MTRIVDSYLSDRRLCYVGKGGRLRSDRVTCGVPQGSVLGLILWNVGYDRVLRTDLPWFYVIIYTLASLTLLKDVSRVAFN